MSGEAWLFLFAVIINAVNLFLQVFFTIMYSDLEWYGIPDKQKTSAFGLQPVARLATSASLLTCAIRCCLHASSLRRQC